MRKAIFRFHRTNALSIRAAKDNYPNESSREDSLILQFQWELRENKKLRNKWTILDSTYTQQDLTLWLSFKVSKNQSAEDLRREIQRCYDVFGMQGSFVFVDIHPEIGVKPRSKDQQRDDLIFAAVVKSLRPKYPKNRHGDLFFDDAKFVKKIRKQVTVPNTGDDFGDYETTKRLVEGCL